MTLIHTISISWVLQRMHQLYIEPITQFHTLTQTFRFKRCTVMDAPGLKEHTWKRWRMKKSTLEKERKQENHQFTHWNSSSVIRFVLLQIVLWLFVQSKSGQMGSTQHQQHYCVYNPGNANTGRSLWHNVCKNVSEQTQFLQTGNEQDYSTCCEVSSLWLWQHYKKDE